VANALSPAPPHQTVHSVFPSTAFRSSSSGGFHSLSPRCSRRYLVQSKSLMQISVGVSFIASALLRMLPSQVYSHPFIEKVLDLFQVAATVTVVIVTRPSTDQFVEFPDDHLFGQTQVFPPGSLNEPLSGNSVLQVTLNTSLQLRGRTAQFPRPDFNWQVICHTRHTVRLVYCASPRVRRRVYTIHSRLSPFNCPGVLSWVLGSKRLAFCFKQEQCSESAAAGVSRMSAL
jgi:hypothetical protein